MERCEVCLAKVVELRRGRCWGCYSRWVETRPVGLGAACTMCGDRRHDHLKSEELLGAWVPICHNCSARAAKIAPMPRSLGDIRSALARDRRLQRRRLDREGDRGARDRRDRDRRQVRALDEEDCVIVDDDMILEMEELAESLACGPKDGDLTAIREIPGDHH